MTERDAPRKKKSLVTMKMVQAESNMSMNKTLQETNFKSILVIGDIQQGKSTVVNMLLGNQLQKVGEGDEIKIEQLIEQEPKIGNG